MSDFDEDREQVIADAIKEGISSILCPAEITDPASVRITRELGRLNKAVYAAAGVHPHMAKDFSGESLSKITSLAGEGTLHAVGEIGLDFHYNFSTPELQLKVFKDQLALAQNLGLPVIVHSREASQHIIDCLDDVGYSGRGVLHCFTEDWAFAQKMLDRDFYISFSGILTFPKAHSLREVAKKIPLDHILVETDAPYLVPVPFRGKIKRNEPKFVRYTARFLAEMRGLSLPEFSRQTAVNFATLFGIELSNLRC